MNIIPKPKHFNLTNKKQFKNKGILYIDPFFISNNYFMDLNFNVQITEFISDSNIKFLFNPELPNIEGYKIDIDSNEIIIEASGIPGLFYAQQSLNQLINQIDNELIADTIVIDDSPFFKWRGSMIDTSRHYISTDYLKKYLDLLAMHKINKFHWHLTDDQGWRIEIKKYPELTNIGSKRRLNTVQNRVEGKYYTQNQIKELVAYAAKRNIEIIPEIDIPGHSTAAIASIKELSCINEELEVATTWGIHNKLLCPGKEFVFQWLEDVIREVAQLFPGRFIHLGGDEALKEYWEECPLCKKRMIENNLKDTKELQSYFIKRTSEIIKKYGKDVLGWEEVLEGGLADGVTIFSWQGVEAGIESANNGNNVIMCPNQSACYFDHKHLDCEDEPGWLGVCTVKNTWEFNPIPEGINKNAKKHILGVQGNIWTELIESPKLLEYMVFPRLTALCETMWCGTDNRNWDDFKVRLTNFKNLLDKKNVNYYKGNLG